MSFPGVGLGTTLQINDGVASAYAAVDGLVDIEPPTTTYEMVESKRLDLSNRRKEYVDGLNDPGTWKFSLEFTQSRYARLAAIASARTEKNYKITLDDATDLVRVIPSKITKLTQDKIEADKIHLIMVELQVTGDES